MSPSDSDDAREDLERPEAEVVEGQVVDPPRRPRPPGHSRLDVRAEESSYTSPLPAPADLRAYAELVPDAPERLLAAGEREQAHRHEIENRIAAIDEAAMPRFYAGQRRGQTFGLIAIIAYLGVMVVAILEGYPLVGAGGAAIGLAALVWAMRRDPTDSPAEVETASGKELATDDE